MVFAMKNVPQVYSSVEDIRNFGRGVFRLSEGFLLSFAPDCFWILLSGEF